MMSIPLGPLALPAAARLAHVTLNWHAYGAEPWALIDVRDGGWNAAAGLNQGERAETVRRYLGAQQLGLSNVLLDPASGLGPALGSRGLPTTLLFDRNGSRVDAHLGELNGAALEAMLSPVLKPSP